MTHRRSVALFALAMVAVCTAAYGRQDRNRSVPQALKPVATLSAQEVFKRVSPSVMVVESLDAQGKVTTLGSGVVIGPGRVITNRHVIEDGVSFRVVHNDNKWPAKLIKVDPDHDLAELSVAGLNAPAVTVLESSRLAVGETVYAIGAPEGLELTISEGLISGLRDFDEGRVIQTSAAISPGSSGGGLFDAQGRLVGITTFYLKGGQSLNFALPAEWIIALNREHANPSPSPSEGSGEFQALAWGEVGYNLYEAGRYVEAERAFRLALQQKRDDEGSWFDLGATYDKLKEYEKAISAYREAVGLKPDLERAWSNLGVCYDHLGQHDKQLSAEEEAVRLNPDDANAWAFLGYAYGDFRRYDKMLSAEEEVVRLKPEDANAWLDLGSAYVILRKYDKAISAFRESVDLKSDDAMAWFALGLAYHRSGQRSEVIRVYEKLKTLDPRLADEFFKKAVLP